MSSAVCAAQAASTVVAATPGAASAGVPVTFLAFIVLGAMVGLVVRLIRLRGRRGALSKSTARASAGGKATGGVPGALPGDTWAGWVRGSSLAQDLARDVRPVARRLWSVVPRPGEYAYVVDLPVIHSRYGAGSYTRVGSSTPSAYYYGNDPAYGSAGIAFYTVASAICDAVESRRTREAAVVRWRDQRHTHVTLTDQRILLAVEGRWASIDLAAITQFYPDLGRHRIELHFADGGPMRFEGTSVPTIAAWLGWALYGSDGLRAHPRLNTLLPETARR